MQGAAWIRTVRHPWPTGHLLRFLFEELDIAAPSCASSILQQACSTERAYPAPVTRLLGEMATTAATIGGNLKQPGELSFQLSGHGPLKSMILDVNQDSQIRGMARFRTRHPRCAACPPCSATASWSCTLDAPLARLPYQSYVPAQRRQPSPKSSRSFLVQSGQQPARLLLRH